jgi:hypothetical protein
VQAKYLRDRLPLADGGQLTHVVVAEGPGLLALEYPVDIPADELPLAECELRGGRRHLYLSLVIPGDRGTVARGP